MEIWKNFDEYYEVSSYGNVRSKQRIVKSTYGGEYIKEGRILRQSDNGLGYLQVPLSYNGKSKKEMVHRLVALVFLPNPFKLPKVNHIDANKKNNNVDNLEWCTQLENVQHAKSLGLMIKGATAVNAKLNEDSVRDIKQMIYAGFSNKDISLLFSVHPGTIQCIRIGRNWSHIN